MRCMPLFTLDLEQNRTEVQKSSLFEYKKTKGNIIQNMPLYLIVSKIYKKKNYSSPSVPTALTQHHHHLASRIQTTIYYTRLVAQVSQQQYKSISNRGSNSRSRTVSKYIRVVEVV